MAEALRLKASRHSPTTSTPLTRSTLTSLSYPQATQKILDHLIHLVQPYTLSITTPLATLQTTQLAPLKPLFDFLRRHAARQAHEFQKAYVATTRWHYETAFRRYVRGLEKLRLRGVERGEPIGAVAMGAEEALGEWQRGKGSAGGGLCGGLTR